MPRVLFILSVLTTAIAFAACGNESQSSSGAAELAPAGSFVYGEATLRPEGDQRAAIDELVSKFPGEGGAGDRIGQLMQKAFAESESGLSYEDDIEPWLGDEAAFFVSGIDAGGRKPDVGALVATEDEDATVAAIEKAGDVRKSEHGGRELYLSTDAEDGAAAVLDGWLVLGTQGGVKAAIDSAEGGETIEDDELYQETLEQASDDRLGFVYLNTPQVLEQLQRTPGAEALGQLRGLLDEPVLVTATADQAGVRFEGSVPAAMMRAFPVVAEGSGAAGELPAGSWLAMAQPDLGKTLEGSLDLVAGAAGDMLRQQFEGQTGLDLDRDVLAWMGDWGVFVRGESVAELDGAMVIETSDEQASARFIDGVARLAREYAEPGMRVLPLDLDGGGEGVTVRSPEIPQPLHLFQRDGKVVIAYGDAAAQDAVDPAETLADSPAFQQAEGALGGDYAVATFVDIAPILDLADSAGAGAEEDWQKVRPYLEPLGALVAGARKDGDRLRSAVGLTVK